MSKVIVIIASVVVVAVTILSLGWGGTAAVAILASLRMDKREPNTYTYNQP